MDRFNLILKVVYLIYYRFSDKKAVQQGIAFLLRLFTSSFFNLAKFKLNFKQQIKSCKNAENSRRKE